MKQKESLIIATRESPLALWQANWVKTQLNALYPKLNIQLLGMTTSADQMLTTPLYKTGGKGLFVKELEEALLDHRAHIAVHSMKDVPMELGDAFMIPVICERDDPRDVFVSHHFAIIEELPENAIVGTSSLRRQSQLLHKRPDITVKFLRGNVNTRLKKLAQGEFAAIILAAAGLKRLNILEGIQTPLSIEDMLPAAGQGALGIECLKSDTATQALIAPLNHLMTAYCVNAERAFARHLGAGCQAPVGSYADIMENTITVRGLVASSDGVKMLCEEKAGPINQGEHLGEALADKLIEQGAKALLGK